MDNIIKNKEEFKSLMKEIDKELKKEGILPKARPIYAAKIISEKFKLDIPIVNEDYFVSGEYSGKSLGSHIYVWYEEIYGDKLKGGSQIGEVVIMIRNDPYRLHLPLIYGNSILISDPTLKKYPNHSVYIEELEKKTLVINILNYIDDLTNNLAKDLKDNEIKQIMNFFVKVYKYLSLLDNKRNLKYKNKLYSDLQTSIDNILSSNPHPGMSKWASLQFAEKLMKGKLSYKLDYIPNSHSLSKLNRMLINQINIKIPKNIIANIQCDTSIRYDDNSTTLLEAIQAHHASLEIIEYLFN